MERLLHYTWEHKLFAAGTLLTTTGQVVNVIDPGLLNFNAGPDFLNAKIRINNELWVGNVEIHNVSSDWMRHGHQHDANYNNVILHVNLVIEQEINQIIIVLVAILKILIQFKWKIMKII